MPWEIREMEGHEGGRHCVVKAGTDEVVACHMTREEAERHMRALYANVEEGKSLGGAPDEVLVFFGAEVKALGNGRVGGYLVRFGSPETADLTGDYFSRETDFGIEDGAKTAIYYNHGLDPTLKRRRLGYGTLRIDDVGVWVEAQLALRDEYEKAIYGMVEAGKQGWSSGTAAHLVEREPAGGAYHITHWPLGLDASITPTPAEARSVAVPLKSLVSLEAPAPEGTEDVPARAMADEPVLSSIKSTGVTTMAEEPKEEQGGAPAGEAPTIERDVEALKTATANLTEVVENILKLMQDAPAIRSAGYYTVDGGKADPEVKSFGDFLLAIKRRDHVRLAKVYSAVKDLSGTTGEQGGFLVPEEYRRELLRIAEEQSQILPYVTRVPVGSDRGSYPALDNYTAPAAGVGDTAAAGGVKATKKAPGATLDETQPRFKLVRWNINKIGGYTEVENELIEDSPLAIETLLRTLFAVAVASRIEYYVLRGTGNGEPLGILNANAAVAVNPVTASTFAYKDALNMVSRFKPIGPNVAARRWLWHNSIIPDVGVFEVSSGSGGVWQANLQATLGDRLLGYPYGTSEHLPQADNAGCVLLADLSAYLLFMRRELTIAFSEHAAFTQDKGTWKFTQRLDGQPWVVDKITLADPQGAYTVSPFIYFND